MIFWKHSRSCFITYLFFDPTGLTVKNFCIAAMGSAPLIPLILSTVLCSSYMTLIGIINIDPYF